MGGDDMPEYEKCRLRRIAENKAKLEALGLPHLASALVHTSARLQPNTRNLKNSKHKRGNREDEDYLPSDDDECSERDSKEESSMDSEEEENNARVISPSGNKGNKKSSMIATKVKKRSNVRKGMNESEFNDDDADLMQAIALSLGVTKGDLAGSSVGISQKNVAIIRDDTQGEKSKVKTQRSAGRKKDHKLSKTRVKLTEDEILAHFFSFDETGKGYIAPWDVKKMVTSHDFSWTDIEIEHMIHSFDSDNDGKLSLEDFRSIVSKCKMMKGTEY